MTKISLLSIVLLSLMNIVKSQSLVGIYGDTYGTASGIFLDPTHDIAEVAQPTPANTDGGMALLLMKQVPQIIIKSGSIRLLRVVLLSP